MRLSAAEKKVNGIFLRDFVDNIFVLTLVCDLLWVCLVPGYHEVPDSCATPNPVMVRRCFTDAKQNDLLCSSFCADALKEMRAISPTDDSA